MSMNAIAVTSQNAAKTASIKEVFMERSSTIAELMEHRRIQAGAKEYKGHTYMDLARFDEATKHMIIQSLIMTNASAV